jgi:hypothetical protein
MSDLTLARREIRNSLVDGYGADRISLVGPHLCHRMTYEGSPMHRGFPLVSCLILVSSAFAQNNNQGNQGNNQNNNNNAGGIVIDAQGIVGPGFVADQSSRLDRKRLRAVAEKTLAADLSAASECRKVSLVRLEAAISDALAAGTALPMDVVHLAGLQQISYVFVDPEGRDLIIAGPADGFAPDAAGRMRGIESGRPTLLLDDLLVALRYVPKSSEVGCSIDPVKDRLVALNQYLAQNSSAASAAVVQGRFQQMPKVLGMQDVRIFGVPADTRFGRALLAADYRLKRISLGLENPGVKGLRSHLAMLSGGGNSLQRWWFAPLYDGLYRSADNLSFEFTGQRVQLMSQEESATTGGDRFAAATTRQSTQAFAKQFTDRYPDLAEQSPLFAELQNLFDWCLVAALIDKEQLATKVGWSMTLLLDEAKLPHETGFVPKQVPSLANSKRVSSGTIIGLVGGGVMVHPASLVVPKNFLTDPARRLDTLRTESLSDQHPDAHPWWWD